MFKISKKHSIMRISIIGIVVTTILTMATLFIHHQLKDSQAITAAGTQVTIADPPDRPLYYGGDSNNWHTRWYKVTINGKTYNAYCAEPQQGDPRGTNTASLATSSADNNLIKLLIYIFEHPTADSTLYNDIYINDSNNVPGNGYWGRDSTAEERKYEYTHAIIGYVYSNDTSGINSNVRGYINTVLGKLRDAIDNNAAVWQAAQNTQLFVAKGTRIVDGKRAQDIVWIETIDTGSITVQKCDNETRACTGSNSGANFAGINIQVCLASNPSSCQTKLTDANGKAVFSGLQASNTGYLVKETSSNTFYQLTDTSAKTITLTTANPNQTVNLYNNINRGSIKVKKHEKDSATPHGSLAGITVEVRNGSNVSIYMATNNQTYAPNAVIYTKTTDANGEVTFENLPATGITYKIKETATNSAYQLTDTSEKTVTLSTNGQTQTVDLYNEIKRGSIIVQKTDSLTGTTPQGNANLAGITIELYNGSELISSKQTDANGQAVFEDLLSNITYTVKETSTNTTNTTYNLTAEPQQVTLSSFGESKTVTIANEVKQGSITIHKADTETPNDLTGNCPTSSSSLSFAGTTFQLTNESSHPIVYDNHTIAVGAQVGDDIILGENQCSFTIQNLPYGTYKLVETKASTGYTKDSTPRSFTIPTNNRDDISYEFDNKPIRGNLKFVKYNDTDQVTMPNTVFSISLLDQNSQVKETHIVVADQNGVVDTSANPHSNHTNGYDALYNSTQTNITYAGYGTWFGLDAMNRQLPVKDNLGALPYGTYVVQELKCDTNMFCNISNQRKTINITDNRTFDLGRWDNTCSEFSISTIASNEADGSKIIEAGQNSVIKDEIAYCAKKGFTYTIHGILMDKSTGEPLLINGQTVENTIPVTPDSDCGTAVMTFEFDSSSIAGKSVVVFEKLYYDNEVKHSHENINDDDQTIDIVSLGTIAVDNSDEDKIIIPGEETKIKDTVSYCAPAGQPYTITGILMDKTTGEPILLNEKPVTQRITFTPTASCGTVEMVFPAIDTTAIAGHPIVAFESLYKAAPDESTEPTELIISHKDLEDADQTVYVISISTTIEPTDDGTKIYPRGNETTVTDIVHYCLQPGLEYTVKGIVMDKNTGNGLLINNQPVEQTVTFTPTEVCGEFPMYYTFNTSDLGGAQLVIFDSLYYNDELLIENKDINNEHESFEIDINVPDTGRFTDNGSIISSIPARVFILLSFIATPIIVYSYKRYRSRKSFLNK